MPMIAVHRETDVIAFARRVMPFLMLREAQHNVMLGLFAVLQARPPEDEPILVWAERGGEVVGAAMRTPPRWTLLAHGSSPDVIEALAVALAAEDPQMPGVLSAAPDAAAFAACWARLTGRVGKIGHHERLYRLDAVVLARSVPGRLCEVTEVDLDLVTDWWQAFANEAIEPTTREQAALAVHLRYGVDPLVGGLRVWEVDGVPVSLVGYTGPTPNSIRIGPVYTPPEQRKRGYATAAVADLSRELLGKGFACVTLFTDLANPISNHIYQTIGFEPLADIDEIHFEPAG